jgi:hypothetical protein
LPSSASRCTSFSTRPAGAPPGCPSTPRSRRRCPRR